MANRKKKLIDTKEAAKILKVSPETITYLRQYEKLPFIKNSKYILFSEPELIRWRNKQLALNAKNVLNLKIYFAKTKLYRFCTYEKFKELVSEIAFLDGDFVIQYLKRQNTLKDIQDLVGDIVTEYWNNLKPKCEKCGSIIISSLGGKLCSACKKKGV